MDTNNIVDVSSFLLFEAFDDSDSSMMPWVGFDNALSIDDDDAESCCGNSSYSDCVNELNDFQVVESDEHEEFPEGEEEEEEGEVVKASKVRQNAEASIAATKIPMNETEESQLFWETCLAS